MQLENMTPSQAEQHQRWKAARARLEVGVAAPNPSQNVVHLVPPVENVGSEMMDMIVAAVGVSMDVPVNEIIAGQSLPEIVSARKLAAGLCVRLPKLDIARVSAHFEISRETVQSALSVLDPILCEYAISAKTPLQKSVPLIAMVWASKVEESRRIPTVRDVQNAVCRAWEVTHVQLISDCKTTDIIEPRHIAMALCRRLTAKGTPTIARLFGKSDHAVVIYAHKKYRELVDLVAERMSPLSTPYEWAMAAYEQAKITRPKMKKRRTDDA